MTSNGVALRADRSVATRSATELYVPRRTPEVTELLRAIVVARPTRGPVELGRELVASERAALEARRQQLRSWTEPAGEDAQGMIADAVLGLFTTRAGAGTEDEMLATAAQYARYLDDLPLWAVERACLRFGQGDVRADEVGERTLSATYRPTAAHVHVVAKALASDARREGDQIAAILGGVPALPPPSADPAREAEARRLFAETARSMRMRAADESALEEARAEVGRQEAEGRRRQQVRQQVADGYRRAGLEPPDWKPGDVPVSLPMMLRLGYVIVEVRGENDAVVGRALMKPTREEVTA